VIVVKSVRERGGRVDSNVIWEYGHTTVPRHLRDVVVTEYGAADLRGQPDETVIAKMIEITDSRFQDELVGRAKRAGKLPGSYRVPDSARRNVPERLEALASEYRNRGHFAPYPFGTELSSVEATLAPALRDLGEKLRTKRLPWPGFRGVASMLSPPAEALPYLQRLDLDEPRTLRDRLLQSLIVCALFARSRLPSADPRMEHFVPTVADPKRE
jgi:hypothetical protein